MKLTRGGVPLYLQLAQIVRGQIQAGEYAPDKSLPTEDEFIELTGVSRTTVRQALQVLMNEGLIRRIAGKGTFVNDTRHRWRQFAVGSIEDIIMSSYQTTLELLSQEVVGATDELAQALGLPGSSQLMRLRGLRSVDGEPFFYFTLHLPLDIAQRIPIATVGNAPIIRLIEEYCGVQIQEARQWVSASLAGSEAAYLLRLQFGDPVLVAERHYVDGAARVVGVTVDRYRTDRIRHFLRVTRTTGSVQLSR